MCPIYSTVSLWFAESRGMISGVRRGGECKIIACTKTGDHWIRLNASHAFAHLVPTIPVKYCLFNLIMNQTRPKEAILHQLVVVVGFKHWFLATRIRDMFPELLRANEKHPDEWHMHLTEGVYLSLVRL